MYPHSKRDILYIESLLQWSSYTPGCPNPKPVWGRFETTSDILHGHRGVKIKGSRIFGVNQYESDYKSLVAHLVV